MRRDEVRYWDMRAEDFRRTSKRSRYETEFMELADIRKGESVFDMGCASGTFAIPLAEAGHHVLACDFSPEMLKQLSREAAARNLLELMDIRQLDWNEKWEGKDLAPCDVAMASRSLIAKDLSEALDRLDSMAERRVILTAPTKFLSRCNIHAAEALGMKPEDAYLEILDLLKKKGKEHALSFIEEEKEVTFDSLESCIRRLEMGFEELDVRQKKDLEEFAIEHYADGRLDVSWPVKWAFISWNK